MRVGPAAPPDDGLSRRPRQVKGPLFVSPEVAQGFCAGLPRLTRIAERSNDETFDYFSGQTTPSALSAWTSDWTVGGSCRVSVSDGGAVGNLSFASSPFFKLRLQCDDIAHLEHLLAAVRLELCNGGQWLGAGLVAGEKIWKFAPSTRSYSGFAIGRAFIRAGWDHDHVQLWLYSYGAKLDFTDFCRRARNASKKHVHDVGEPRALVFERQCIIDVGRDYFTPDPVVVCPDLSRLRSPTFSQCTVNITPMWGRLGEGLGGFYLTGLDGAYSKVKVYNKWQSLWRASKATFVLGRQAVFKTATHDFVSGRFRDTIETGLDRLIHDDAVCWTRIEVRRELGMSLRDLSWFADITNTLDHVKNAVVARSIPKPDLINYCSSAYDLAVRAGLFAVGGNHRTADRRVHRFSAVSTWQFEDANRLAYVLGWVYVNDVLRMHHKEISGQAWGPGGGGGHESGYMLPEGLAIPEAYVYKGAPVGAGLAFTLAAHELADVGIDWAAVSPDDDEAARELRVLAMHLHWSRQYLPSTGGSRFRLTLLNSLEVGPTRTWDHLEAAVVDLLTIQPGGGRFNYDTFKSFSDR